MANVVRTVNCPNCHRDWTGSFSEENKKDSMECKDCRETRLQPDESDR